MDPSRGWVARAPRLPAERERPSLLRGCQVAEGDMSQRQRLAPDSRWSRRSGHKAFASETERSAAGTLAGTSGPKEKIKRPYISESSLDGGGAVTVNSPDQHGICT